MNKYNHSHLDMEKFRKNQFQVKILLVSSQSPFFSSRCLQIMNFWHHCQLIILLIASFSVVQSQKYNCITTLSSGLGAIYDSISNFQSGAAKLENSKRGQRYNHYNISLSTRFTSSYELAISIENIKSFQPSQGYDFFVNGIKRATMVEVIFAIDTATTWSQAQIYFLVSARPDFAVGFFVADNTAFLNVLPNGTSVTVTHHLTRSLNVSSNFLYAIPFISGLRTFDLTTNFSFTSARYNSNRDTLAVNLLLSYSKTPLETLYLSYLIFNMESDLEITSFTNLSYAPSNVNVFIGVSGISPNPHIISSLQGSNNTNITTKPLLGLGSSLQNQQKFDMIFGINGVIVQTQQSMDLLFRSLSPSNSTAEVVECVSKSKCNNLDGTMTYTQTNVFNINSKCLVCMNNGFYNQASGLCQCVKGYVFNNGSCIRISDSCLGNSYYSVQTLTCVCNNLYVNISGKCVSIYSACTAGQIYFQGKCIRIVYSNANTANCSNDSLFINKTCVKKLVCSPPFQLNNATNTCDCPPSTRQQQKDCVSCAVNETLVGQTCQCKPAYFRIQGNCLACSPNAFFNGTTCVCFRYYTGDGFKCTQASSTNAELARSAPKGAFGNSFNLGGAVILN